MRSDGLRALRRAGICFLLAAWATLSAATAPERTPDEWKKLADQGDAEAIYQYSDLLLKGKGVLRNEAESFRLLQKSAAQGHVVSQRALGMRYKSGTGAAQDIVEAVEWLKKAAASGDVDAQTTLAICYATGDGTPKDEVAAARWLERAAKAGSKFGESTLSSMVLRGIPKNDEEAAAIYKNGAQRGELADQIAYAACLEEGRGTLQNRSDAAKWYRIAAKRGDLLAKYRAGLLLQDAPETIVEAYEWLEIAGIEGTNAARTAAEALKPKVPAVEQAPALARAKARAKPAKIDVPEHNSGLPGLSPREIARGAIGNGSGFFVTENGYLVTNHHVVERGGRFEVQKGTTKFAASVVAKDPVADLAVLKVEGKFSPLEISESDSVLLGDEVLTVGFPMPGIQGLSPKYSAGDIGSLNGMRDDPGEFQVSLPLQPGNSGGALVSRKTGKAVGVVRSVLRAGRARLGDDAAPQAVNYAVKSSQLLKFLGNLPEVQKNLFKVEGRSEPSSIKQAESASVLIWVYEN